MVQMLYYSYYDPCTFTYYYNNIIGEDSICVNLDNLLFQLRSQITFKWYQFGLAVGIESEILDKFAEHCAPEDCIMEMLDHWLRKSTHKPTWNDVAKALRIVELPQLALDIESVYTTGKILYLGNMHYIYYTE